MNDQKTRPSAKLSTLAIARSGKMQKARTSPTHQNFDRAAEFKLVVAYDYFSKVNWAEYLFEPLARKVRKLFTLIQRFLKFKEFSQHHAVERQPIEAAAVHIVAIVAEEQADLLNLAEQWTQRWKKAGRAEDRRLLALFSTRLKENNRWANPQARLPQFVRRTGKRFDLQATKMPIMRRVPDTNPKATQAMHEDRKTMRSIFDNGLDQIPRQGAASAETIVGIQLGIQSTAVSKAIIDVMRLRQRKSCSPNMRLASGRSMRLREMNRSRVSSNL